MKNFLSLFVALIMLSLFNTSAFAKSDEVFAADDYITAQNFENLEQVSSDDEEVSVCATGLITGYRVALAKDGNYLIIKGGTECTEEVKKCGFKYIKLQQYKNGSWVDYKTFEDLYADSNSYTVTKSVAAEKGYSYRVVAQHYAKKSLFSTEKIVNSTSSLSF